MHIISKYTIYDGQRQFYGVRSGVAHARPIIIWLLTRLARFYCTERDIVVANPSVPLPNAATASKRMHKLEIFAIYLGNDKR